MAQEHGEDPKVPGLAEVGGAVDGERVTLDRRLFVQLLAYGQCRDSAPLLAQLQEAEIPAVLYDDVNDPTGVALIAVYENPERFIGELRPVLQSGAFAHLAPKPHLTMFGRTYAFGYEKDLVHSLITKPQQRLAAEKNQWGVWYPLRRKGEYETLTAEEQLDVQTDHMRAGRAFARETGIEDVRLACHGLDENDNDFVVGLMGARLVPLSLVVQLMRKSKQTSRYLEKLGPFFVGKVAGRTIRAPESNPG
jgi:chlorite dismutase